MSLWASCFAWVVLYDTVYAHQDKRDDVLIGVKSTALRWGDKSKQFMAVCGAVQMSFLTLAGVLNGQGAIFYAISVLGGSAHLGALLHFVDLNNVASCWTWFKRSVHTGLIIWAGIALDWMLGGLF